MAVDTSALMAVLLNAPGADACVPALEADADLLISDGKVAEALIVAARRNVREGWNASSNGQASRWSA